MFYFGNIFSFCMALFILIIPAEGYSENSSLSLQQLPPGELSVDRFTDQSSTAGGSLDEGRLRGGSGDPVAGKDKADMCSGCHGEDGNSIDAATPKLAGQYGAYIAKQVRDYQDSLRSHQMMDSIATSISDEDLADISAYFATRPMMKGDIPSKNRTGKKLFENDDLSRMIVRCSSCHGVYGKGQNPRNSMFPVIGGQHKEYLLGQLLRFKKGDLHNSPNGVMNISVRGLSDAELEALADYISGL